MGSIQLALQPYAKTQDYELIRQRAIFSKKPRLTRPAAKVAFNTGHALRSTVLAMQNCHAAIYRPGKQPHSNDSNGSKTMQTYKSFEIRGTSSALNMTDADIITNDPSMNQPLAMLHHAQPNGQCGKLV